VNDVHAVAWKNLDVMPAQTAGEMSVLFTATEIAVRRIGEGLFAVRLFDAA
jgi:hypothetical protein